jgi:hypothetical protein
MANSEFFTFLNILYVCMYVKFIYIAHLSCKHATNDAEVQSSVGGTKNFIGRMRYGGGESLVSI